MWEVTAPGGKVTKKTIWPALELIFARESKSYEAVLVLLTGQQLKCLTALARVGGKMPHSTAFLRVSGIGTPASVKKC
jgi:hypothetical protein